MGSCGEKLLALRQREGLTQREVAVRMLWSDPVIPIMNGGAPTRPIGRCWNWRACMG